MKSISRTALSVSLFAALFILFVSCRKEAVEVVNPDRHYCYTYTDQFETIWTGIDQGYLFWDRDTVDWDAVHERMLPVFKAFDSKGYATDNELDRAYKQMVHGLLDHHMYVQVKNLKTGNPVYADPAWDEVPMRDYYHYTPFNQQVALLQGMDGVTEYNQGDDNFPCYSALFPGTDGKKIAYLRFRSFAVTSTARAVANGALPLTTISPFRWFYGNDITNGVTNGWAGRDNVQAVIIDLRGNGGGNLEDIRPVICSLTPSNSDIGYSRHKEGLGRLDYSAWTPLVIESHPNHLDGSKKVVLLVDVNSVSCSELSACIVQAMPHGIVIGERTYGATCPLMPGGHNMLYSGVFGNYGSLGYYVYTSNFDVVDRDFKSLEGVGVIPDIECLFDPSALAAGHDNQLERALQYLRTGH